MRTNEYDAKDRTAAGQPVGKEDMQRHEWVPKFRRYNDWGVLCPISTAEWSETADPLPTPPSSMLNDPNVTSTISKNPQLFSIITPIKVQRFRQLLANHPNPKFVKSVADAFETGFWPWAKQPSNYPDKYDASHSHHSAEEAAFLFLKQKRDEEFTKGRYSKPFNHLLPGMYAMPVHAVPKASGGFRLITNHSQPPFSLNEMISKAEMGSVPLDGPKLLGFDILQFSQQYPGKQLAMWKSDVAEAYRLIPMHPYWQIKQVERIDSQFQVNRCNVFGGRGSQKCFIAFMSLVVWIATNVQHIQVKSFSDDNFGVCLASEMAYYERYKGFFPRPQVELLKLWDQLGIPHNPEKQVFGSPLTIIGIDVNPNSLQFTLPPSKAKELVLEIDKWVQKDSPITANGTKLRSFLRLAGWINWALNVWPWLRPCLSSLYAEIADKTSMDATVHTNNAIRRELRWAKKHIGSSLCIHLLKSVHWKPNDAEYSVFTDACLEGMGFYVPALNLGFHSPTITAPGVDQKIVFHEALAVLSAIAWVDSRSTKPTKIFIQTDNTNTVEMFSSLSTKPALNPILITACDIAMTKGHDFKVAFIPGEKNTIADAISHEDFRKASRLHPNLRVSTFRPPQLTSGSDE